MITFPIAKINLGLNIVERRSDGYHNLETVFYPIPIKDAIEINVMHNDFPSSVDCDLKVSNMDIKGDEQKNLVVKAYNLLAEGHKLPRIHVHLYKNIPTQAGMGGGSSDCAFMLKLLNEQFNLNLSDCDLERYACQLGADCPFFIKSRPAYAEGIGEILTPINIDLKGWHLSVIRPDVPIPTKEAFALIKPRPTIKKCIEIVKQPVETWKHELHNDFEESVFASHPELAEIKKQLYTLGATYASMSGSGSSIYALSRTPIDIQQSFTGMYKFQTQL